MSMKTIVVSAVNLNVGGTLTILRDCLQFLSGLAEKENCRVVALVHKKELAFYPHIEYIEMRWPKKAWVARLWCEYVTMRRISERLSPVTLWFSLHDTTPRVVAEHRAVYCHNPFPCYCWRMREWLFSPKVVLFSLLSKFAYRVNIHCNTYVVVQQQWIREEFMRLFQIADNKIIVAPPSSGKSISELPSVHTSREVQEFRFLFAASPNSHKNFECFCEAVRMIHQQYPEMKFRADITLRGDENNYSKWLYKRWGSNLPPLHFIGFQDREKLYSYYRCCDCLVFPSKVETWGLPIAEFGAFGKPMLLADLPYAYETSGGCSQVAFFHPERPGELAEKMLRLMKGERSFLVDIEKKNIRSPKAESWEELFKILLA